MEKVIKFLKMMWLVIAIVSFCIATYHLIFTAVTDALFFYFFSAMAMFLFYVRKRQQKRFENMSK